MLPSAHGPLCRSLSVQRSFFPERDGDCRKAPGILEEPGDPVACALPFPLLSERPVDLIQRRAAYYGKLPRLGVCPGGSSQGQLRYLGQRLPWHCLWLEGPDALPVANSFCNIHLVISSLLYHGYHIACEAAAAGDLVSACSPSNAASRFGSVHIMPPTLVSPLQRSRGLLFCHPWFGQSAQYTPVVSHRYGRFCNPAQGPSLTHVCS